MKKGRLQQMLGGGSSARKSLDESLRAQFIDQLSGVHASVLGGAAWEAADGHGEANPHRPALTAHAENFARTLGAKIFGK